MCKWRTKNNFFNFNVRMETVACSCTNAGFTLFLPSWSLWKNNSCNYGTLCTCRYFILGFLYLVQSIKMSLHLAMISKMIFKIIRITKVRPKISSNILLKFFLCLTSVKLWKQIIYSRLFMIKKINKNGTTLYVLRCDW